MEQLNKWSKGICREGNIIRVTRDWGRGDGAGGTSHATSASDSDSVDEHVGGVGGNDGANAVDGIGVVGVLAKDVLAKDPSKDPSKGPSTPPPVIVTLLPSFELKINESPPLPYGHVHLSRPRVGSPPPPGIIFTPPPPKNSEQDGTEKELSDSGKENSTSTNNTKGTTVYAGASALTRILNTPPQTSNITYLSSHPVYLFHLSSHLPKDFITSVPEPLHGLLRGMLKDRVCQKGVKLKFTHDRFVRYVVKNSSHPNAETDADSTPSNNLTSSDVYAASRSQPDVMERIVCRDFVHVPMTGYPFGYVDETGVNVKGIVRQRFGGEALKVNGWGLGKEGVTIGEEGREVEGGQVEVSESQLGGFYVGGEVGKEWECIYGTGDGVGVWYYVDGKGRVRGVGVIGFDVGENVEREIRRMVGRRREEAVLWGCGRGKVRKGTGKGRWTREDEGLGYGGGGEGDEEVGERKERIREEVFMTEEDINRWRSKGDNWWGSYRKEVYGGGRTDGWGKWLRR
ncbi:hypothetical protein TrCOL_g13862 [Triparma columacea]|uniref:Uncharacterized protein n=1 Tax=Triparma columacea TaxID=722753 RepID=A0A9W7G5X2_9STRA|nr:hypothetical protein TrCOL_g13862 [Triparma columacea]